MEDNGKREEELVVAKKPKQFKSVTEELAPEAAPAATTVPTPTAKDSSVPAGVQDTIDNASVDSRIKIRSKAVADAVSDLLKVSNPKRLSVEHKPNLGHHSIAVR